MQVDHHDLYREFPDMRPGIEVLKKCHPRFAHLFSQYQRLTGQVEDLEEHDIPVSDYTLEYMKKHRVKLKDELFHLLMAFKAGQESRFQA
jgi:uncharacterized protein YdcH (DUF465 family)